MEPRATVAVVVGTRPELVKLAPVVAELGERARFETVLVHTGQHYDEQLSDAFFEELPLPEPDHHLGVGSDRHAVQTGEMLAGLGEILGELEPEFTVAQGDTNSVLAAAVAASGLPTTFCHVEAGLRSHDRSMPEETNRALADTVEGLRFAPTELAAENLAAEGVTDGVHVVGNTVADACRTYRPVARNRSDVLERVGVAPSEYAVATIHRPRNTGEPERLRAIIDGLAAAPEPVVMPTHPRTRRAIESLDVEVGGALECIEPVPYLDFLRLLDESALVVTDSGGVQEEAAVLEVPCLTVRPNTERPETVDAGVNELLAPVEVGERVATLLASDAARRELTGAPDLFGDGDAAGRIVDVLAAELPGR